MEVPVDGVIAVGIGKVDLIVNLIAVILAAGDDGGFCLRACRGSPLVHEDSGRRIHEIGISRDGAVESLGGQHVS